MNCWKCKKPLPNGKIGFRAVCPSCGIDLHTCSNCRYYSLGKPNNCLIPGTESIRDREAANFCEDFKEKVALEGGKTSDKQKFNSLFKDDL